jgi:hypothetical protein
MTAIFDIGAVPLSLDLFNVRIAERDHSVCRLGRFTHSGHLLNFVTFIWLFYLFSLFDQMNE